MQDTAWRLASNQGVLALLQVILMDHVDWLDEQAASQLATRLADQVCTVLVPSQASTVALGNLLQLYLCKAAQVMFVLTHSMAGCTSMLMTL